MRGHNEGSIFARTIRRKSATYVVWTAAVTADGRRLTAACPHRHRVGERQCREAGRLLERLQERAALGTADPRRIRVGPYLERWVSKVQGLAPATLRQHEMIVRVHLAPSRLGRLTLAQLSPSAVDDYLGEKALDPQTLRHHRSTLRRALADGIREGLITRNAAALAHAPRLPHRERRALDPSEVRRLLDTTRGDRLHALWAMGSLCGLRLSEALGLAWSDIDGEYVHVRAQLGRDEQGWCRVPLKTRKSERSIRMPQRAREAIAAHRVIQEQERGEAPEGIDGYVFLTPDGKNIHGPNVLPPLYRALAAAGLPRVTFHDLRHSAATALFAAGVPLPVISDILGHSTIRITADLYRHRVPELAAEAADRLDALLGREN